MEPKFEDVKSSIHPRDIPFDLITQNILTRLPIKPLIRFKSVSKQWYSTISSPQFRLTHLKFQHTSPLESLLIQTDNQFGICSYENDEIRLANIDVEFDVGDETLVLIGSCNGLVCLGSTSGRLFVIWNPATREFLKYSDSEIVDFSPKELMVTWGFGYVSAVDDYKVVRICKKELEPSFAVHVISIRFDKWRRLDNDTSHTSPNFYGLKIAEDLRAPGVLLNETLYWMGGAPHKYIVLPRKIMSFDLALEMFDTFPHLEVSGTANYGDCFDLFLCVVKGSLSKYGSLVGTHEGLITVLRHDGETEEFFLPRNVIDLTCANLIEFRKKNVIFTLYRKSRRHNQCLGIITKLSWPRKHKQLIAFDKVTKIEMIIYSSSLISPLWLQGRAFEDVNN